MRVHTWGSFGPPGSRLPTVRARVRSPDRNDPAPRPVSGRARGPAVRWGIVLVVAVAFLLSPALTIGTSAAPASVATALHTADPGPAKVTRYAVNGSVQGNVNGYGSGPYLGSVKVTVYSANCSSSRPSPATCPVVKRTTTNSSGEFRVNLPKGTYYFATLPEHSTRGAAYPQGFGGSWTYVVVNNITSTRLAVYPEVNYGNATIVLPKYACDSAYLNDEGTSGPGCQNPVLSWTQSGAYYLTAADELVFYSFVNASLSNISSWVPLYQSFPTYAMIPNELEITQDGTYVYGWGTLSSGSDILTAEAVNVTTHRLFEYNFTGVTTANVAENGQVELTGWDGNDSELTLILANGEVLEHDLWNSTQEKVGVLDYFEANNAYWMPYLNGYVNVQAEGSSGDGVEEWQLTGPTSPLLVRTFDGNWGSGTKVNGVNGIAFNVTSRELSFQAQWTGVTYAVNSTGALTSLVQKTNDYPAGTPPDFAVGPVSESDRPLLVASGPMVGTYYAGYLNGSFLISMVPGHLGFYDTNVSPYAPNNEIGEIPDFAWQQSSQEGQYYTGSYLIAPDSYMCASNHHGACTIDGGDGAAVGTIWWMWKLGVPEFPDPPSSPSANVVAPPPTVVDVDKTTESSIALRWTAPELSGAVNYSVAWGTSPKFTHYAALDPTNTTYTIRGLTPATTYYFSVEEWNLHFHGTSAGASSATTPSAPGSFPAPPFRASGSALEFRGGGANNRSIGGPVIAPGFEGTSPSYGSPAPGAARASFRPSAGANRDPPAETGIPEVGRAAILSRVGPPS